jgi:hypothetical protein
VSEVATIESREEEAPPQTGVLALIERVALDPAADVEKLERLFAMHERMLANHAREAFAAAFVRMKPQLPRVIKTHKNDQTNSLYAKLEDINQQLDPLLERFGFGTATKIVAQSDALITIRCELWHQQGHVEFTELSMPPDDSGIAGKVNKTKPHAIASTVTYLKRVGLCALLNISTGDDKDGNAPDTKISEEQVGEIRRMMLCIKDGEARLLKYMRVETVEEIPSQKYRKAISALDQQIAKEKGNDAS